MDIDFDMSQEDMEHEANMALGWDDDSDFDDDDSIFAQIPYCIMCGAPYVNEHRLCENPNCRGSDNYDGPEDDEYDAD